LLSLATDRPDGLREKHVAKLLYRFHGKGLSVAQPWASAIAFAGKDIENRSWRTHYRGPLAIHASGTMFRDNLEHLQKAVRAGEKRPLIEWINKGRRRYGLEAQESPEVSHIVAITMLTGCVEKSSSPWRGSSEWGWVIEGVIPIEPIPWIGGLGVWDCKLKYRPLTTIR
jgi:hypothetical protein